MNEFEKKILKKLTVISIILVCNEALLLLITLLLGVIIQK